MKLLPVIAPNIRSKRLLKLNPGLIYILSNFKITGSDFGLHQSLYDCIQQIRSLSKAKLGIGFGVDKAFEVSEILQIADFAIIGSSLN